MWKLILYFLLLAVPSSTQSQIYFQNPSFEDEPQDATTPTGWLPCDKLTTPDILPGYWSVYNQPSDGETYVGLITRSDGSWETIGQRTAQSLQKLNCYKFFLDLAHSNTYEGYSAAIKLRIWGGENKCNKDQLLYESPTISQKKWSKHLVQFMVQEEINYIIFEAFINGEYEFTDKGNILIDNLSAIKACPRS